MPNLPANNPIYILLPAPADDKQNNAALPSGNSPSLGHENFMSNNYVNIAVDESAIPVFFENSVFANCELYPEPNGPTLTIVQAPEQGPSVNSLMTSFMPNAYFYCPPSAHFLPQEYAQQAFLSCSEPITFNMVPNDTNNMASSSDHAAVPVMNPSLYAPSTSKHHGIPVTNLHAPSSSGHQSMITTNQQTSNFAFLERTGRGVPLANEFHEETKDVLAYPCKRYQNFTVFWNKLNKMARKRKTVKLPHRKRKFTTRQMAEVIHGAFFRRTSIEHLCARLKVSQPTRWRWVQRGLKDSMQRLAQEIASNKMDIDATSSTDNDSESDD